MAAVVKAGGLNHMPRIDQLFKHARQALLGDPQDLQQLGNRHTGLSVDEVENTVMRPPESDLFQNKIRVGGKVAIGKKQ